MSKSIKEQVDYANSRGVGQFHLFDTNGMYAQTWRSWETAKAIADRNEMLVYNDSAELVHVPDSLEYAATASSRREFNSFEA